MVPHEETGRAVGFQAEPLRLALEKLLSRARRDAVSITAYKREPSPVAVKGLFPIEVLRVSLDDGEEVVLFVKHLGTEQADHPDKRCRDREPRMYEDLLIGDDLPVPRYYGSRWNELTQRREVFLEYIGDWSLKYQKIDYWYPAARRLAQFHAHFARRATELSALDYLLRLDASYFQRWAERAQAVVARREAPLAQRLSDVIENYGPCAELLGRQPSTLVHNDLAPKNVLVDRKQTPTRICFADWEVAGVGCGLLDLVHLKHGLEPAADREMCRVYCEALDGTGLLPSDPSELQRLFAACELHQTLYRLAFSEEWQLPLDQVARWLDEACNLAARVGDAETP